MARGARGVLGNLLGCSAQLIDGCGHAVGTVGLLIGIEHRRVGGIHYRLGNFIELYRGGGYFTHRVVDSFYKEVEAVAQIPELVFALNRQAFGQITFAGSDIVHGAAHQVERPHQYAQKHSQQKDDQHHRNDSRHDGRVSELAQ